MRFRQASVFVALAVMAGLVSMAVTCVESGYPVDRHLTPTAAYLQENIPPCTDIPGGGVDPCAPDAGVVTTAFTPTSGDWINLYDTPFTVRQVLEGDSLISISHLVVRGTFIRDSGRCEANVPFRTPSYVEPGYFQNSKVIQCYADIRANSYLLGSGPSELTVLVSFLHYWDGYYADVAEAEGMTEAEIVEQIRLAHLETLGFSPGIYGVEAVLFLGPPHNHATEAWEIYALWDVQRLEDDSIVAVHPHRNEWREARPDDYQTHKAALEIPLSSLKQQLSAADNARQTEYGGKIAPATIERKASGVTLPQLTPDGNKLERFLTSTGANTHPDGVPADPPPACGLPVGAPSRNAALVQDCEALIGSFDALRGSATLRWGLDTDIARWEGLTVDGTPRRVTKLKLANKGLTGTIPERLADLGALVELKLSGNNFTGCIPLALKGVATNDLSSLNLLYCRPLAPANLAAGTITEASIPLTWNAVANTSKYRIEYREGKAGDWTVDDESLTVASHTLDDLECGQEYQFRVSAYGSGTVYASEWSVPSAPLTGSTAQCVTPVFDEESYTFTLTDNSEIWGRCRERQGHRPATERHPDV